MKSGCLVILEALGTLDPVTLDRLKAAICLAPDEEIGSTHSSGWRDELARRSRQAPVCEGASKPGLFSEARKGVSHSGINLRGHGAHAGFCPGKARGAIDAVARCILSVNTPAKGNVTVNFGVVKGGTVANAEAERCRTRDDVRFWALSQWDDFQNALKAKVAGSFGLDIEAGYKVLLTSPPWFTMKGLPR